MSFKYFVHIHNNFFFSPLLFTSTHTYITFLSLFISISHSLSSISSPLSSFIGSTATVWRANSLTHHPANPPHHFVFSTHLYSLNTQHGGCILALPWRRNTPTTFTSIRIYIYTYYIYHLACIRTLCIGPHLLQSFTRCGHVRTPCRLYIFSWYPLLL